MTPLEAAWEAVLAAPDDDQALQVLADALMERGDPHGELIRLQLAGDEAAASQHLARHARELFGEAELLRRCSPRLARGFLEVIRVESSTDLRALLDRPVSRLLREVLLDSELEPIELVVTELATRAPRTLSTVRFSTTAIHLGDSKAIAVAALVARLTSLKELRVCTWPADFSSSLSPSLRRLAIDLQNPVIGLGEARFPGLEALELILPFRRLDLPLGLLADEVAPKLTTLTISGALWPQQLTDLAVSTLLRGLTTLTLAAETETAWYPALLETIDSFAHLKRFELFADRHHPEWVQAVKAALPQAVIREPQLRL